MLLNISVFIDILVRRARPDPACCTILELYQLDKTGGQTGAVAVVTDHVTSSEVVVVVVVTVVVGGAAPALHRPADQS